MEDEELNQKAEELKKFKQQNLKSLEEKKKLHQDRILKEASDMKTKKKVNKL